MELFKPDIGEFFEQVNIQITKTYGLKKANQFVETEGQEGDLELEMEKNSALKKDHYRKIREVSIGHLLKPTFN